VGESPRLRPSPPLAPRPPGSGISQGKPVCPFASRRFSRWPVRAPQGVRGPPQQPFPSYSGSLPLSLAMVFTGPSPVDAGYCAESYSPMANARPSSPPPRLRTTRGEVPPLERGTCTFPPSHPYRPVFCSLSPYEVPELGVRPAQNGRAGPQAGCSAKGGSLTLPCSA
jgi:hypothetical protein